MTDIFEEFPKEGTKRWKICNIFLENESMTTEQFVEKFGKMNAPNIANLRCEFDELVREGLLRRTKGVFTASYKLKTGVKSDKIEYVQPRTPPPFKPMSAKHYLPKVSPRGQPLREFCHIGLANGAKEEESRNDISVLNEVMSGLQA